MGPPETTIWEYPGEDLSWRDEMAHFTKCLQAGGPLGGDLEDALAALQVIEAVYKQAGAQTACPALMNAAA
jgi:predicted dehydrogenase